MKSLIDRLRKGKRLEACEYRSLLLCSEEDAESLHHAARDVAVEHFGNSIFIRGLIEISNVCRNDCLYCGIRKSNTSVKRYTLTDEQILQCCRQGHALGFRTFVLQGGEMPPNRDEDIIRLCRKIRNEFPDCAITLSLGERSGSAYRIFREAGADRYLLRHETHNAGHYSMLHPPGMSLQHRLQCLDILKSFGYQTGTGIMTGSPYQSIDNIVEDILYIQDFKPEMIGLGPFIPHSGTPFADYWEPAGSHVPESTLMPGLDRRQAAMESALRLISIFRLIFPDALIPATTALATISPRGRERGILAGANVLMPNLSPPQVRDDYSLYDGKASSGAEAAEGLAGLKEKLSEIGYRIVTDRGDYRQRNVRRN